MKNGYIEIPKDFVPVGRITTKHIEKMVAKMGKTVNEHNLAVTQSKIIKFKEEIRASAKLQMEKWIFDQCSKLDLRVGNEQRKARTIKDLEELFASQVSKKIYSQIWMVLIGQFEIGTSNPFRDFENVYMEERKWRYSHTESDKKMKSGFVEQLILRQKREKLKLVNAVGKKTHGYSLRISRDSNMITEKNKYKKRKKGVFENYMIRKDPKKQVRLAIESIWTNPIRNH